ncbi:hypothetical protein IAQ61_002901 [Plenodomus lingam]|uniref:Similar to DUF602 domain-containing protein n=1 Tax=Leptosphaeria maculans (strain JN3 / isolate v23.1.3 / race Av1-4-5-6-7-8) TaxID=985895 RepID=E5A8C6_LEPMJ|nr:similar to DUF602 domain-containing protein [Plenodomus lingam JN3]KAH9877534.1 hypothetical protein IAQ61_002901 [Plenodomus lingam]CBX99871.1 similar to DUF602 domain-containing protein [Plenodomus lingam JN3]
MGNDGGSIPKRRELVKEAAKSLTTAQLKEALVEQQEYSWSTDPLTRKPLANPIVSDAAGILYNKDSIIEFLLKDDGDAAKSEMKRVGGVKASVEGGFVELGTFGDRVRSLKDVVEVKFEVAEPEAGAGEKTRGERWVCPVTGTVLGPSAKAVYIVPCGHAFAGSVVKEVKENACLTCNQPYAETDIIPIIPSLPTDIARLNQRAKSLREKGLTHALKKAPGSKKRKKDTSDLDAKPDLSTTNPIPSDHTATPTTTSTTAKPSQPTPTPTPTSTSLQNPSTASLTRKVLAEQDRLNKRRKLAQNTHLNSLFNKSEDRPSVANSADYMTRGFSIARK